MSGIIRIDSRVAGFSDQPIRLIGAAFADTGELVIQKTAVYSNLPVPSDLRDQTVVVTDSPDQVQNWQLSFNAKEHLEEVISIYQARFRAKLIEIEPKLNQYNPKNVLEIRKVDKNGLQQEFDSSSLNNGHIAILLAVWASTKIAKGFSITEGNQFEEDAVDPTMLPFSIY
ncbi:hypothetical protein NDS20_000392 [Acinetobacter baumannii]|uniref:Uncharacterized protein n=1 Tax=Acinetobacter baumannii TaxID=470 RepID=A0AAP1A8L6_ACIBA|nr:MULTISPECIES: hypothetical protein [Acinetobacter]ANC35799.1 hypothetical protein Aba3207_03845 [Acinetobacter baumannii]AVO92895.1 hypothetical protein AM480_19550 [Acinetobacter baumannii]AXX39735.1 hypothetical protein Aba9201_01255 [Acinetobacter baumannii]EHZ7611753.1 hypothetical protein [Acinetobacter baumannii]EIR6160214.1 hypothetical protein [Acinetobacter baumannii]